MVLLENSVIFDHSVPHFQMDQHHQQDDTTAKWISVIFGSSK
jgi:hypothetical protein